MSKVKYTVVEPLRYNHKVHRPRPDGKPVLISVDDEHAADMIERGLIAAAGGGNPAAMLDEVVAEIKLLVVDVADGKITEKDAFTGDGRPDANVLSDRLDAKVTGKLRDQAWVEYQKQAGE